MTLGTGIALLGVWLFAGLFCSNKRTTGAGVLLGLAVAVVMTLVIV